MHISDGILPMTVAAGGAAASLGLAYMSVRRTRNEDLPKVAIVTAAFFVASLIHVPLGPTSVHLLIPGLVGVLLGPVSFLAIALGLLLQCLLFQFGGLTALGANALMLGLPALGCGYLFHTLKGQSRRRHTAIAALAGGSGTLLGALILALLLATGGEDFTGVAKIALLAHLPVAGIEAGVSAFAVSFLLRVKPDILCSECAVLDTRNYGP